MGCDAAGCDPLDPDERRLFARAGVGGCSATRMMPETRPFGKGS